MEENNELNDIILNKSGSGSKSKKLLLAIATLTLVLIIVLVIMNSLKSENNEQLSQAVPVEPSAPTEITDDPLFEPVQVIEEGSNTTEMAPDLGQIAQKIKQQSFENAPVQETVVKPAAVVPAPAAKVESKPVQKAIIIPTIKTAKPAEPKTINTAKPVSAAPAPTAAPREGAYYIQVGVFSKEPSKALFDRLKASGLKYTTAPKGSATKVLVGPFQSEKAARDVLGTVRKNIESNAFVVKG